ncbi:MAG: Ppx/GppA phosphatase family protein [Solirubrobacteraceae bacterium]
MRVAVVDIGTNSTRLLIAEMSDGRVSRQLARESNVTRLGAGVDTDGRLSEDGIERVCRTLEQYRREIERHDAHRRIAVLTSAVRDAENGAEFARTVQSRYGLDPRVLTGEEEAQLTFLGATSERDPSDQTPTVVIDVGGGSTELVIGSAQEAGFHVSTQAGVVRQTERHIREDPPTPAELDELSKDARKILAQGVPLAQRSAVSHAIAVAGTATSLAAIAQALDPYDPDKVHGYRLTAHQCEEMLANLSSLALDQRRAVPGLHPDRAPTIIAGVIILLQALTLFELQEVEVSEHDILRGAALEHGS